MKLINKILNKIYIIKIVCFNSYRFTQVAVDPQVKVPGGKTYDVLFIGTGKFNIILLPF